MRTNGYSGNRSRQKALFLSCFLFLFLAGQAVLAETGVLRNHAVKEIDLMAGKSMVLRTEEPVKRVSVADPEIADIMTLSPTEFYITGKKIGSTNLTLWSNKRVIGVYNLEVEQDVSRLKERLNETLPGESDIRIIPTRDSLTLAGRVSNTANLQKALAISSAFAPKDKEGVPQVKNLLEVGGVHQVMLEVRVAEMSRQLSRRLGVNFGYGNGDDFGVSLLGALTSVVSPDEADVLISGLSEMAKFEDFPIGIDISPAVNAFFRFHHNNSSWTGFLDALKEDGLVKVLAEPTLITLSGQEARFLAGGEFPVPIPQGLGTVAIEYRPFGVGLTFSPIVLSEDKISIRVAPEVSELDFSTAIQFTGFVVPGLTTRRASTTVVLGDGESFAIAGLLRDTTRDTIQKFPLLGDIPVLGALFQSHSFQKNETELVIIVTPHLVKPTEADSLPLPTDYYADPNDIEFYLLGLNEGLADEASSRVTGRLDGDFGHEMP